MATGWGIGGGAGALQEAHPVVLPGAFWHDRRDAPSARTWRVWVQGPLDATATSPHPVWYVLDGSACFGLAAQLARNATLRPRDVRGRVPIVVGIDQVPGDDTPALRESDFTPPGASALGRFIASELMPEIGARWPVDSGSQTLFGHSLGGLFALHMLLTQPNLFSHYVVASPSLWWRGEWLPRHAPALAARLQQPLRAQVALCAGALEQAGAAATPQRAAVLRERQPIALARQFAQWLQTTADERSWPLKASFTVLGGLDHGTVRDRALMDGLHQLVGRAAP